MRLWHQKLIPFLPRQQLLGQHRECAALRGKGWGKKHSVVDYVFTYSPDELVAYHYLVMDEMIARGYHPDETWRDPNWRGSTLGRVEGWSYQDTVDDIYDCNGMIYDEHNDAYLRECIENLKSKGIDVSEMEVLLK
jgi:uncharacterized protein (TIGR02328 family)